MECGKTTNPSSDHAAVIVMQKDASALFDHTFLKPENATTSFTCYLGPNRFPPYRTTDL